MANSAPPFPLDSDSLRRGVDPEQEALFGRVLSYVYNVLPDPPVSVDGNLCILFDADGGGVDRLSLLPDALLGNIVSRLPIKDAARTAVLSRRWRPIWRATPLVLVDTHLLPAGEDEIPNHLDRASSSAVAAAVSSILAAHPGPFRCVRVACCYMDKHRAKLARWLQLLADKGVQELFLINRPWPLEPKEPIPSTLFNMAELACLYLSFWSFPDTTRLPRSAAFPQLRELGLCTLYIETQDLEFVLSRSPVLEILCFEGLLLPLRFRLVSNSLRCLQIDGCKLDSIAVVSAPRLERFLLLSIVPSNDSKRVIKIVHAPALRVFGRFELEKDKLQLGNTVIKAGIVGNPNLTISSVKILAVDVRFGVCSDTKMLPTFLGCFPNIVTLHIHSKGTTESTGKVSMKFWQESSAIKSALSRISKIAFHDFRSERNEVAFLKFVIENAPMLATLVIAYANGCFGSREEASSKAKALFAGKRARQSCLLLVFKDSGSGLWNFSKMVLISLVTTLLGSCSVAPLGSAIGLLVFMTCMTLFWFVG